MPGIPTEELARYRTTTCARAIQREQELLAYRKQAWPVARTAAALLRTSYGMERVMLFGSLARNKSRFPHSDIDLVAWSLPEPLYYRVVAQLLDLDAPIPIDLLRGEDLSERRQQRIQTEGVAL